MSKKIYQFYCDPGHGWLKVTLAELESLKILHKITSCSYVKGDHIYLEEDCDAVIFAQAKDKIGEKVITKGKYSDRASRIRSYDRYEPIMALKDYPDVIVIVNSYRNGECDCTTLNSGSNIRKNENIMVNEKDLITINEAKKV